MNGRHIRTVLTLALAVLVGLGPAPLARAGDDPEVFVIGGSEVYAEALPRADRLYLTVVHAEVDGDAFFPEVDWGRWELVEDEGVRFLVRIVSNLARKAEAGREEREAVAGEEYERAAELRDRISALEAS